MVSPIRDYLERWRTTGSGRRQSGSASQATDACCTFQRAPGEEWSFDGQSVLLNGRDVSDLLDGGDGEVSTWCGVIDALGEYRSFADARPFSQKGRLTGVIGGLQERALSQLGRVYDEKMGGIAVKWGDGQLLINNVNVRAMLAMFHVRPTNKAKKFLEGLKNKLSLILCNQTTNHHVARAQEVVRELYDEVCSSLATPAIDTLCLPSGDRDRIG